MWDVLAQVLGTIGAIMGFTEWRYRVLHGCMHRIENRLDKHIDKLGGDAFESETEI